MAGGIKHAYSELARQFMLSTENEVKNYLERAKERKLKFWNNWKETDIDEFVEKFAPDAEETRVSERKIIIDDEVNHTQVVMDPVGYVRVMDTSRSVKKMDYLDIDGVPIRTYMQRKGETEQEFRDRKMIASHFRIKKRGE